MVSLGQLIITTEQRSQSPKINLSKICALVFARFSRCLPGSTLGSWWLTNTPHFSHEVEPHYSSLLATLASFFVGYSNAPCRHQFPLAPPHLASLYTSLLSSSPKSSTTLSTCTSESSPLLPYMYSGCLITRTTHERLFPESFTTSLPVV